MNSMSPYRAHYSDSLPKEGKTGMGNDKFPSSLNDTNLAKSKDPFVRKDCRLFTV